MQAIRHNQEALCLRRKNHGRLRAEDRKQNDDPEFCRPDRHRNAFNNLIEIVIDDNPSGCVGYTGSDGVPVPGVIRNREYYTLMSGVLRRRRRQTHRDRLPAVPLDRRI